MLPALRTIAVYAPATRLVNEPLACHVVPFILYSKVPVPPVATIVIEPVFKPHDKGSICVTLTKLGFVGSFTSTAVGYVCSHLPSAFFTFTIYEPAAKLENTLFVVQFPPLSMLYKSDPPTLVAVTETEPLFTPQLLVGVAFTAVIFAAVGEVITTFGTVAGQFPVKSVTFTL